MMPEPPFAEDLEVGIPLVPAPAVTIDRGVAAAYQAIAGDYLRLCVSDVDSLEVTGRLDRLANPALVLNVAIGQSTVATQRVIANLYYRNVALYRQVHLGDTLTTTVTPTASSWTSAGARGGRAKVLLSINTVDDHQRPIAKFERLALLPVRDPALFREVGDIARPVTRRPLADFVDFAPHTWSIERAAFAKGRTCSGYVDPLADTVTGALELVRLTNNLAGAHRDPRAGLGGRRLVYGGHTVGLAQASLTRSVQSILTVVGWQSCDHLDAVFEGDVLRFTIDELDVLPIGENAFLVEYMVRAAVESRSGQTLRSSIPVLDWRPVAFVATPLGGS